MVNMNMSTMKATVSSAVQLLMGLVLKVPMVNMSMVTEQTSAYIVALRPLGLVQKAPMGSMRSRGGRLYGDASSL